MKPRELQKLTTSLEDHGIAMKYPSLKFISLNITIAITF
jgi:hypothetical protein